MRFVIHPFHSAIASNVAPSLYRGGVPSPLDGSALPLMLSTYLPDCFRLSVSCDICSTQKAPSPTRISQIDTSRRPDRLHGSRLAVQYRSIVGQLLRQSASACPRNSPTPRHSSALATLQSLSSRTRPPHTTLTLVSSAPSTLCTPYRPPLLSYSRYPPVRSFVRWYVVDTPRLAATL